MKFVIDRSKWRCGEGECGTKGMGRGRAKLLNGEGFMCCLGFASLQLGATPHEIVNRNYPRNAETEANLSILRQRDQYGDWEDTALAARAAQINDSASIGQEERETQLAELFTKHGHSIEFTGEYVTP